MKSGQFTADNSKAMQARSAAKRKENTERRKALAEYLRAELQKPYTKGGKLTKIEYLTAQMVQSLEKECTISDLLKLQRLLGEDKISVSVEDGNSPAERLAALIKESRL